MSITNDKIIVTISVFVTILSLASILVLDLSERDESQPEPATEAPDASVKVAVLNGCGRSGLAAMFAEKLRAEGFDVVNGFGENADSFDFDVSVVIDRKGGNHDKAESAAQALGIENVIEQRSDDVYIIEEVTVVLGRDWNTLLSSGRESTD
ncbi:MAG: LytR C-terminal domain-containing protein [Candidatus Latescibacteria bacterium]|nr:LytR C-terminal domain-containing protein [Candidatus Latescibacterota bacterium]